MDLLEVRQPIPPGYVAFKNGSPQQREQHVYAVAQTTLLDFLQRCQLTNARKLEKAMIKQVSVEQLEDLLDSFQDIPLLEQLLSLPEGSPDEQKLKNAFLVEMRTTLAKAIQTLEQKKKAFLQIIARSDKSPWQQQARHLFDETAAKIEALIYGFTFSKGWFSPPETKLIEDLDRKELQQYKKSVDQKIKNGMQSVENRTAIDRIAASRRLFEEVSKQAKDQQASLLKAGRFLQLHRLKQVQNRQYSLVKKAKIDLTSTSRMQYYAKTLEEAKAAIADATHKSDQEIDPLEQLRLLQGTRSPLYQALHRRLTDQARARLDAYEKVLDHYAGLVSKAISLFEQRGAGDTADLKSLEDSILKRKTEILPRKTLYLARTYFWQKPTPVPLDNLTPWQLKNYLNEVEGMADRGVRELNEKAVSSGFRLN